MKNKIFYQSLIAALCTDFLDFMFHVFLTNPMESLTYFVIKFLLAFFIATFLFSLKAMNTARKNLKLISFMGLVFSTLMSIYYRAWELGEAHVPFESRAPDIIGIERTNLLLFSGTWWLGHALFFVLGVLIALKVIKER
ncbi:hypothetical protein HYY69_02705 [Candidatus Woesearchaeota archaeon]|nr:hypothetical protein [Candidatus Woesearchaeota archaeon]